MDSSAIGMVCQLSGYDRGGLPLLFLVQAAFTVGAFLYQLIIGLHVSGAKIPGCVIVDILLAALFALVFGDIVLRLPRELVRIPSGSLGTNGLRGFRVLNQLVQRLCDE